MRVLYKQRLMLLLVFAWLSGKGQIRQPEIPDSLFSAYYHHQVSLFRTMPHTQNDILFVGNSITDGNEWSELFGDPRIKNRGISADISKGVVKRIDEIVLRQPAKVFLMIGINDVLRNLSKDSLLNNIFWIANYLKQESPRTRLYVQSLLPVNRKMRTIKDADKKEATILEVNKKLHHQATRLGYTFIDLHPHFANAQGALDKGYTLDGLHLNGSVYALWKHLIYPFVKDVQEKPSLLPLPEQVSWGRGYFPIYRPGKILISTKELKKDAQLLQKELEKKGFVFALSKENEGNEPVIHLKLDEKIKGSEGYELSVSKTRVKIVASAPHGIFNGIQTLYQLMRSGSLIDVCEIKDQPAFVWRGYMVDVGRNFQSMKLLKQQIDMMSKYKLNIFHFHGTEDIAWRFAIRQYPQLTAGENMIRNQGFFYNETEIKELIQYCKDRYITLIPEIDMPGHSAAFERAMGTDMQTDSGLNYVKQILKEFIATYQPPYLHIGGDEVKIVNKNFLPEVIRLIQSLGVATIGWSPGGNLDDKTIRQLWMEDIRQVDTSHLTFIDSRHLYLNHMDPFEGVTTLFYRQIGNRERMDDRMKGAILCNWPDRRVEHENDALKMNLVYPGLLAFAERTWRGGGIKGWQSNIGQPGEPQTLEFAAFENRLLDQKKQYFSHRSFPYVAQQALAWKLYGPYNNGGDLSKKFDPETKPGSLSKQPFYKEMVGATVVLRHWWAPLIAGALDEVAKENTTWYATTKIWSGQDQLKDFWIGFYNLSRSMATDTPPAQGWDYKKSAVWVNGLPIAPPNWKRAGLKGNLEIPLIDEGYEYRVATRIQLKKGWNEVLIKAPVGSFKGKSWENPVKWMFTFTPID